MKRSVTFIGLCVNHVGFPCHNHCGFCVLGHRRKKNSIPFSRVVALMDRLRDWRNRNRPKDFRLFINYFRAMNHDRETTVAMSQLDRRLRESPRELMMGGIEFKTDDELKPWLQERRDVGMKVIRLSLAGTQPSHDKWVGRPGDFDFNLRAARLASEIGFERHEWLLVSRSTIPHLEALVARLNEIPGRVYRGFRLLTWGNAPKKLEERERITREMFEALPEWVRKDVQHTSILKSEREWTEEARKLPDEEPPEPFYLILNVEDASMEWLEATSCDAIVSDVEERSRRIYETVPTMKALGAMYGNRENECMYWRSEMQHVWARRFLEEEGLEVEKHLTWVA